MAKKLPPAAWTSVLPYLDDVDAVRTATALPTVSNLCRVRIQRKTALVASVHDAIVRLFGGRETIARLPILEWRNCFLGPTDDLDQIRSGDMHSSIMIGSDVYSRPFIAMRSSGVDARVSAVDVLFQRYPNTTETWHFLSGGIVRDEFLACNLTSMLESHRCGGVGGFETLERTSSDNVTTVRRWLV